MCVSLKRVCPARIQHIKHKAKRAKTHIIQDAPSKTHIMWRIKNIVSSKILMVVRRKRGCHSGASPSLVVCYFFEYYLRVPQASPSLAFFLSSFLHPNRERWLFNKSYIRTPKPTKQIKVEPSVAMVKDLSLLQDAANAKLRSETLQRNCVRCHNCKRWCMKTVRNV